MNTLPPPVGDPWSGRWPALARWVGTSPAHPLRSDYEGSIGQDIMLSILNDMMQDLDDAGLERLPSKRKRFARASTFEECMDARNEVLVADKLLLAGVGFEFLPEGGRPQPDIALLDMPLRLEITSRWTTQLSHLQAALEQDLAGSGFSVVISCSESPVRILPGEQRRIRDKVRVLVDAGEPFEFDECIGSWRFRQSCLRLRLAGTPAGTRDAAVVDWQITGAALSDHLGDVETLICDKLTDEAKSRQATDGPTMLIVEGSRAGQAWIRSDQVWKGVVHKLLQDADTKFVALGLMFVDNVNPDVRFYAAVHRGCPAESAAAVEAVEAAILTPTPGRRA